MMSIKKTLLCVVLMGTSTLFGQEVKYENTVLNNAGFPFPTIRVCTEPATGTPCTPLATGIFSDPAGTQPLANPFTGDAAGNFRFYGSTSVTYHVQVSGTGIQTYDIPYITLPAGVSSCSGFGIQINGTLLACADTINFNNTTPSAPSNALNVLWATSKVGSVDSVSAAIVGDGNANHCLLGNGTFGVCGTSGNWNPLQVNGVSLASGDTVNFNNTTPIAPTNGINITWAKSTAGGVDSVSAAIVGDGNATHCLLGNGTFASCGGGAVTGSGTTNLVPVWTSSTALGNSNISSTASTLQFGTTRLSGAVGIIETSQYTGAGAACPDNSSVPLAQPSCLGYQLLVQNESTGTVGAMAGLAVQTNNSFVPATKLVGIYNNTGAGFNVTDEWGAYIFADDPVSVTVTNRHGLFALAYNDSGHTSALNEAISAQSGGNSGTSTLDYTIHVLAPNTNNTMTTHVGLQIDAQGVGSAIVTGNDPSSFGGRVKFADQGSCTMSTGTCSAQSLSATYTAAPKCIATWTGAGTLAGTLKIASSTTTVTPSSSTGTDTAVVNWICFGN